MAALKRSVEGAGYDVADVRRSDERGSRDDAALEEADITLVRGELTSVVEAMGLLHPMIGVVAMTASSLSVIGNSILLRRHRFQALPDSVSASAPASEKAGAAG